MSLAFRVGVVAVVLGPAVARAEPPVEARAQQQAGGRSLAADPAPPAAPAVRAPLVTSHLAQRCVAAAFRAAGYPRTRAALASMEARARAAALLPEVSLRASRSTDASLRLAPTVDDPYRYSEVGGAGVLLEARLIWHLDRVIFDRDELSVERLRGDRADAAAKLAAKVVETLFAWQRATLRASDPALGPEEQEQAGLAAAESAVVLDVLTAGWFGDPGRDRSR